MSFLTHLGLHLAHNNTVKGVVKSAAVAAAGTTVGSVGVAAGSALSTVGATTIGGAVTSAGATMMAGAASALGGGAIATGVISTIATGAAIVGTAAPFVALGYGCYRFGKYIARKLE